MPAIHLAIPADLHATLLAQARRAPPGAVCSPGRALLAAWHQHQAARQVEAAQLRAQRAHDLLRDYWPVVRAEAARWFSRLRGEVPLDELISAATEEAAKAAHRFDPALGYSPAPFLRRWAHFGCRALVADRRGDTLVRPDGDEDGSRWERIGAADEGLELGPDGRALDGAIEVVRAGLDRQGRRILRALLRGDDDDEIAARARCDLGQVDEVRRQLAAALAARGLGPRPDDELAPVQVAELVGCSIKVVSKALASGAVPGRRRAGAWVVRKADAQAFARGRMARTNGGSPMADKKTATKKSTKAPAKAPAKKPAAKKPAAKKAPAKKAPAATEG